MSETLNTVAQLHRRADSNRSLNPRLQTPASQSRSFAKLDSRPLTEELKSNKAKLTLLCQMKDPMQTGILDYKDMLDAVKNLRDDESVKIGELDQLLSNSGSIQGGKVKYQQFLSSIGQKRPNTSSSVARSDITANYNYASVQPLARSIWDKKMEIVQTAKSNGMRPRLIQTPGELLQLLRKSGINCNIHQLKAFMNHSGLQKGSILDLIQSARGVAVPMSAGSSVYSDFQDSRQRQVRPQTPIRTNDYLDKVRNCLKKYPLTQLYQRATGGRRRIRMEDFLNVVLENFQGTLKPYEITKAFQQAAQGKLELDEQEFVQHFQAHEARTHLLERCFKILKIWLRDSKITTEQGFRQLLRMGNAQEKLNIEQFTRALRQLGFNSYESEQLFDEINTKQNGMIDLAEWTNKVYEDGGPLQWIRDVILKFNLNTEDLLIKMNIKDKQQLNIEDLTRALLKMDPTLSTMKAVDIASHITGSRGQISVKDLMLQLSQGPMQYTGDWKDQILKKIQVKAQGHPNRLIELFEQADANHSGKLPLADFQDCLYKANFGLMDIEIERLARILDRKDTRLIDYNAFLDRLKGPMLPEPDLLKECLSRLLIFLRHNKLNTLRLLKKLGNPVSVNTFANFLHQKIMKKANMGKLFDVADKIDLNQDGLIDLEDLNSSLNNISNMTLDHPFPYPSKRLTMDQAKVVINQISQALQSKRVNLIEAFNRCDTQHKGIISCKEFSDGISKFIELSQPAKNGIFAIMDKQSIGIIDQKAFLDVLKDNKIEQQQHGDGWNWEAEVIQQIRDWIQSENLTIEDAFRAFDKDYDGIINKKDLRRSLVEILQYDDKEIFSSKLDRIYKLMDTYKRNSVQLADFKVLFEEGFQPEWKNSAIQQIGLALSKKFPNLHNSFEIISEYTGKITFQKFYNWIESSQALDGFNLTYQLLQQLFAQLDPHKKGFLSESDWNLAFSKFNWKKQQFSELKDAIRSTFGDLSSAFDYFLNYTSNPTQGIIQFNEFVSGVQALIPSRYTRVELEELWNKIVKGKAQMDIDDFHQHFQSLRFLSNFTQTKSTVFRPRSTAGISAYSSVRSGLSINFSELNPMKKLNQLLKAAQIPIEKLFEIADVGKKGRLTPVEFRNTIRYLNLALTSREIDIIFNRADTNKNGYIEIKEFISKFRATDTENQIQSITQKWIQRLRERMYSYMLSPNDAFWQFDSIRSGRLVFGQFQAMVTRLCQLAGDNVPAFNVIKDLFDYIDIRKDGVIDQIEWKNQFGQQDKRSWQSTEQFEEIAKHIARNRKVLLLTFEVLNKSGQVTVNQAKETIGSVLRGVRLNNQQWWQIFQGAERDGLVDYRFLLDIYKDRANVRSLHPVP